MDKIRQDSILISHTLPLRMVSSGPNQAFIAGGVASIPTGRFSDIESTRLEHLLEWGASQSEEGRLPTKPGLQIFGDEPQQIECCECCCGSPCEEPEPPQAYFELRDNCSCPIDTSKPFELANVGIFLDGWDGNAKYRGEGQEGSIISYLCKRYSGPSIYALGPHFPGGPLPVPREIKEGAVEFADRIAKNIRDYTCWLTETFGEEPDLGLRRCARMNIDIFGFSRGGYVAARIVEKLAEPLICKKCKASFELVNGVPVRFLALIEPARQFPLNLPEYRAEEIPANVEVSWLANGAKSRINYHIHNSDARNKAGREKNKQPDYDLDHGEMGDAMKKDSAGRSPREDLETFYNDAMLTFKDAPRFEEKEIQGKVGDCGGPIR